MEEPGGVSSSPFPEFRYHPNPVLTKSVIASSVNCVACGRRRGFIYDGPVIAAEDYDKAFCPWCIADGSASDRFEAEFTDSIYDVPNDVPAGTIREIAARTPGFFGWQQGHWLYHCGDGAAFLGCVGASELEQYSDAVEAIRSEMSDSRWSEGQIDNFVNSLRNFQSPSAYLFQCLRCERYLAYTDFL